MALNLSLEGRRALVCGGSRGIGRAIALELVGLGADVTVLARDRQHLEAAVKDLGSGARVLEADLDDASALGKVRAHLEEHGDLHVLINNTGGPPAGLLLEATADAIQLALGRHLLAAHELVKLLLPGMKRAGFGRIVNVVSTSVREPIPNLGVSNTTRAAVAGWAKSLSKELPPGVTINNVLPGFTSTERLDSLRQAVAARTNQTPDEVNAGWLQTVPEGRLGRPEEVAAVAAFLASPAAAYVRGVSLAVDGGRMASI